MSSRLHQLFRNKYVYKNLCDIELLPEIPLGILPKKKINLQKIISNICLAMSLEFLLDFFFWKFPRYPPQVPPKIYPKIPPGFSLRNILKIQKFPWKNPMNFPLKVSQGLILQDCFSNSFMIFIRNPLEILKKCFDRFLQKLLD